MQHIELIFLAMAIALTAGGALLFYLLATTATENPFPKQKTIKIRDYDIHYSTQGQGPHVLLIHGLGASLHCWTELAPLLAQHYTVIALDLPGFGESTKNTKQKYGLDEQADRIEEFLNALHIERCFVVGNSMGGNLALWLASRNPQRFPKIAVIAPAAHPKLVRWPYRNANALALVAGPFSWMFNRRLATFLHRQTLGLPENLSHKHVLQTLNTYRGQRDAVHSFFSAIAAIKDPRLLTFTLESKVLILYGERDKVVPRWAIDLLKARLPDATLVIHPQGGHQLQHDFPNWAEENIAKFFSHDSTM